MRNIGKEHLHKDDIVHYENNDIILVELDVAEQAVNIQQNILESAVAIMKQMVLKYNVSDDEVINFIQFLENT